MTEIERKELEGEKMKAVRNYLKKYGIIAEVLEAEIDTLAWDIINDPAVHINFREATYEDCRRLDKGDVSALVVDAKSQHDFYDSIGDVVMPIENYIDYLIERYTWAYYNTDEEENVTRERAIESIIERIQDPDILVNIIGCAQTQIDNILGED